MMSNGIGFRLFKLVINFHKFYKGQISFDY